MNNQTSLAVEFVGLPGAGKTTVSERVGKRLRADGIQLVMRNEVLEKWHQASVYEKLFQLFPARPDHWRILLSSLIFALQVRPISWWSISKAIKTFSNIKRNDTVAETEDYQLILLDQGPMQEAWSVMMAGELSRSKYLKREITLLADKRPTVIVYFKLDIDTAISRIQERPTKQNCPFDLMSPIKAQSSLLNYFPYLQKIVDYARNSGVPVLEIDASSSIDEQSDEIAKWIASQVGMTGKLQTA